MADFILPYPERLLTLGLQFLESRHLYLDILFLVKLKCNYFDLYVCNFFSFTPRLHGHCLISLAAYRVLLIIVTIYLICL